MRKSKIIQSLVTSNEFDAVKLKAEEDGRTVSDFVRRVLVREVVRG